MSTLLHVILDRAPALATLAQECKGCPGTLCKGCHGTEHALGCPAGLRPATPLSARMDEREPRRAALAWTAGCGCPYVGFAFSCKLARDETPPFPVRSAGIDRLVILFDCRRIRVRLQRPP